MESQALPNKGNLQLDARAGSRSAHLKKEMEAEPELPANALTCVIKQQHSTEQVSMTTKIPFGQLQLEPPLYHSRPTRGVCSGPNNPQMQSKPSMRQLNEKSNPPPHSIPENVHPRTRYVNALEIELETRFRAILSNFVTNVGLQIKATSPISVKIAFDFDFGAISSSKSS